MVIVAMPLGAHLVIWSITIFLGYYILPYLTTYSSLRRIPAASFWAAFSNFWLALQSRRVKRSLTVHEAHLRKGEVVRIQPNHVSIANKNAIQIIYGHGNGFLKSDFYDAFVTFGPGLFSTRDRNEHTRKRKTVSHTFSAKSVAQFEQYMRCHLDVLIRQWDGRCQNANGQFARIDSMRWSNYLAFDIIGDLAFGQPFGMLEKGQDITEVKSKIDGQISYCRAIESINVRGELMNTLGSVPFLIPYAKYIPDPLVQRGLRAKGGVHGIGVASVSARLEAGSGHDRVDILARLIEGKDENGQPMGKAELLSEALTQIVAGSDTTSTALCALTYWMLKTPRILERLQKELDSVLPDDVEIPTFEQVKDLPYLKMVINEALRVHPPVSLGLPRVVPPGPGVELCGHFFPPGTVLSVPIYTMHHSKEIWGSDADEFKPERWETVTEEQRAAFIPFSVGPRSCIGRNVAEMELILAVATIAFRYDFRLYEEEWSLRESLLRKPTGCEIGIRLRVRPQNSTI
ncbi:uncharacterized protein Z520_12280 [Fonsecaea multimorphosa CBS 102226]|uniref:Benzoate 4-monooxygenase n=1 Tax=Fonsecaea multimorphosa CBS 102226 TaxID=1442371 RepID=A0A0D2JNE7_9EURO|nr:uncharacterized protein Z520_12280 [Fonsecaea multimorphosa CBS 102226]KIX92009.1 hypothetical protein Z520_12280 [Fonsecaea multimorphosa CBS 102226]OAL17366.1 hypothetical protein AYO22_11733 [Fonsecaea multimorphosa]